MLYVSIFDAKNSTTQSQINQERQDWLTKGKDKVLQQKCKTINRYEVLGSSPLKIFFVIETDDPTAVNLLSRHFGDAWNSTTYPIIKREIYEAMEEDHSIIGG